MADNLPVLTLFVKWGKSCVQMPKLNKKSFFLKLGIILFLVTLALFIWMPRPFATSFFAGGIVMMLNFYVLFSLLEGIFGGDNAKAGGYLFLLIGKFAGLGAVVFVVIRFLKADITGFGLGFFLVAISATYATSSLQKQA